eukprot:80864-Heterocapsa_arctica.AAC.1
MVVAALGLAINWRKGRRGSDIEWIGVLLSIHLANGTITATLTAKFVRELTEEIDTFLSVGMIGIKRLRTFTGKMSWAAGVLPRTRWAVRILYS